MTENLPRVLQNIFGENAMQGNKIAQFGSVIAGAPLYTGDIEEIQALQYWQNGWVGATFSDKRYPTSEETTGINKVVTQQLKYLFQKGIPEWHIDEVYYKNSYCQVNGAVFLSLTDDNIGHNPVGDSVNWIEALKAKEQDLSISNALSTGEVKNESKLYEQILRRAHSTFDKSKFEVVGSPNITDDGIASGFSIGNFINLGKYNIQNELHIKCNSNNVNLTGTNRGAIYSWYQNEQNYFRLFWYSNTQLRFDYFKQDESSVTANSFNYDANGNYIFDIIYKNNQLSLLKDGEVIYTYNGAINLTALNLVDGQLGVQTVGSWYLENGSIDLKFIASWADGVPVFNGNKTGLYIAKSDNYEVVGSPTITEDGILSDLSNSNYIKTNINLSSTYRIEIDLDILDTPSVSQFFIDIFRGTKHLKGYIGSSGNLEFLFQDGTTNRYCGSVKPNFNQKNKILFELTQDQAITQCNDSSQTITRNSIPVEYILTGECIFYIGKSEVIKSINLNSIKVYSDGNLVYQPCLKIPYTESKTGSKIVDVAYRDRVQDLYEQTGEALFYTLDEENQNFTLPMSDIYGMIEKSRNGKMPVGTIFAHTCSADFVPENSLPCDGSEYTESQFPNLYVDWLISGRLNTCTYEEYQAEITATGECLKWALDTENKKFKVPTKLNKWITGIENNIPVKGNGKSIGLTAGLGGYAGMSHGGSAHFDVDSSYYNVSLPKQSGNVNSFTTNYVLGLTDESNKSGIVVDTEGYIITQEIRYFVVVATGSINQSEMDWSEWATGLQIKLNADHSNDTKPYITETYKNGQSGYRIWSDGYCEQWGYTTFNANGTTVTFPKEFIDANYTLLCQINPGSGVHYGQTICVTAYNSSSFTANGGNTSSLQNKNGWWKACGYITV